MPIQIKACADDNFKPLNHYWDFCVGAGRACEGLRAGWRKHLKTAVKECGFRYLRFHGLFHDDMFVYREENGKAIYNWQYIDDLFDFMLEIGIRPFVELGFCPGDLASEKNTVMWWNGHGSPPNDYGKWQKLVENFVRHCLERYGLEEIKTWYFEVWNEPNLDPFFRGKKSQYFELYRVTAQAVKAVNEKLKVGGPATSNFVPDERFDGEQEDISKQVTFKVDDLDSLSWKGVWIEEFLNFCSKEQLPLDFLSTHPYPTDFALDGPGDCLGRTRSVDSTKQDLLWLQNIINESDYPEAEIHLTEWSSSPSSRDHSHDYLQAATFVVKTNIESTGLVDSLSYWVFTDVFEEAGAGDTVFHGGFGMINFQGIPKPVFHAYRFLSKLGDLEIARTNGAIITRNSVDGKMSALIYHYPPEMKRAVPMSSGSRDKAEETLNMGFDEELELEISGLKPDALFVLESLDKKHGFALKVWEQMGCPEPPNREETALLKKAGETTGKEFISVNADGVIVLKKNLEPWTVLQLREI
jgi:xylan 1,4-beta-xylosidase